MKGFEYAHAASVEEVFSHVGESWDVRILAGGTDLLQEMKNDIVQPSKIIDIKSIQDSPAKRPSPKRGESRSQG